MSTQLTQEVEVLREILKWIKFSGMKQVKATLEEVLDTNQKRLAYQLSDRTRTTRKVAGLAGFGSKTTVADLWKVWYRLALGETVSVRRGDRFKRSFDLADFGISVSSPKMKVPPPTDQSDEEEVESIVKQ
jgi:hypothetical protein